MKKMKAQAESEEEAGYSLERDLQQYWQRLEEGAVPERLRELAAKLEQARHQEHREADCTNSDTGQASRGITLSAVQRTASRVADTAASEQLDSPRQVRNVWASHSDKAE